MEDKNMTTRFISGNRTAEDIIRAYYEKLQRQTEEEKILPRRNAVPPPPSAPTAITASGDYLLLENLACVDADGVVFEQYGQLYVKKDIFRNPDGKQTNLTPYQAVVHCEQNSLFLPSFALSCNIAAAAYKNRTDPEINKFLLQYKDKGNGFGYHGQNTIIDFGGEEIIHYPNAADFGQKTVVNTARQRKTGKFAKATLQDGLLEDALKDTAHIRYVKQLTGLVQPEILVEMGKYFGRPARLWFPWPGQAGATFTNKMAAWFGCNSFSLDLDTGGNLNSYDAARGVREI